jgi:preprotein translocase subunit SecG
MKEIHAIRVTILLSYLVLVTRGKDFGTIGPWENTSKILIDRQVNKTIVVRTTTVLYIYNFFFVANKQRKHQTRWKMEMSMIALMQITNQLSTIHY